MDSGKRDQIIYFESPTTTNVRGEKITTWGDLGGNSPPEHDWARVLEPRGSEAFESARQNATEIIRLVVNYRSDVMTDHRIKWNDQYYYITAVDRTKRRQNELWITAKIVGVQ